MVRVRRNTVSECEVPDELRCRRTDSKKWRCPEPRVEERGYCPYHLHLIRETYHKRKHRKSSNALDLPPNLSSQGKSGQIALDFSPPAQIYDEKELPAFLNMDPWKELFLPAEKQRLLRFLPKGEQSEGFVESLLSGDILRFGINPAKKWWSRVCNGELRQEALLRNEEKLKAVESQFYRDLVAFNRTSISEAQELKRVCLDICQSDERKFRMHIRRIRKGERRLKGRS